MPSRRSVLTYRMENRLKAQRLREQEEANMPLQFADLVQAMDRPELERVVSIMRIATSFSPAARPFDIQFS